MTASFQTAGVPVGTGTDSNVWKTSRTVQFHILHTLCNNSHTTTSDHKKYPDKSVSKFPVHNTGHTPHMPFSNNNTKTPVENLFFVSLLHKTNQDLCKISPSVFDILLL